MGKYGWPTLLFLIDVDYGKPDHGGGARPPEGDTSVLTKTYRKKQANQQKFEWTRARLSAQLQPGSIGATAGATTAQAHGTRPQRLPIPRLVVIMTTSRRQHRRQGVASPATVTPFRLDPSRRTRPLAR